MSQKATSSQFSSKSSSSASSFTPLSAPSRLSQQLSTPVQRVISVKKANLNCMGYKSLLHWLEDPAHIYIGRDMSHYVQGANESKWGNPFSVKKYGLASCLNQYSEMINSNKELLNSLPELKGKVLGCWCRTVNDTGTEIMCHGDILYQMVKKLEEQKEGK